MLAETQSYSTSGICIVLFLIENQYRATVQLLRNPAFLIVRGGGGGGPPPTNQKLGLGFESFRGFELKRYRIYT